MLIDNGDLIQGTPLGTYKAKINPLKEEGIHLAIRAMKPMDYEIATLGNHEFNYVLAFPGEVYNNAAFPVITPTSIC